MVSGLVATSPGALPTGMVAVTVSVFPLITDTVLPKVWAAKSAVLVLRGEPGIGKTALLGYVAERAAGFRVVRAAGAESEMELPFAGLHQLCGPMLGGVGRLPTPQRDALGTAFGLTSGPQPDRFLIGLAVLSLLSGTAGERPLLCLIDDAQWLDRSSAQVLAFVARRMQAESVVLLFAEREPGQRDELAGLPDLIDVTIGEATTRGEGVGVAICAYAHAVLCNGLGLHDEALAAARDACADPAEMVAHNWGMIELVESAARTGRTDLAAEALQRLTTKAQACRTGWAVGIEARSRALLSDGDIAERGFREAVEHLSRARVRGELARAHLLYGEWLRRENRRVDARHELTLAEEMFTAMGMEGFAERTRRELLAAGATVRQRTVHAVDQLTQQEGLIARLARDGLSNPEIGAQLFISTRTVEWHMRKVFTKLGVSSRRQLRLAMADRGRPVTAG